MWGFPLSNVCVVSPLYMRHLAIAVHPVVAADLGEATGYPC